MLCPSCNHENREGRKFCASCGAQLALACPSCGSRNESGERFCGECGHTLDPSATVPARTPTPQPTPVLPTAFADGRYQVQRFLGEGGRKRVYLAHDERLDREVAIAVIKTEGLDAEGLTRVQREAQAMGRLGDHPNIVTVFDIGQDGAQPYIVSQYMPGGDLEGLIREAEGHRLPLDQTLRIANQVRQGLEHAHSRGIIHRDLKPGNIWLAEDGTAMLGDFGLAVALDKSRMTMAGMMLGTVAYMPPEQALGRQPDARSDLYSLGCVVYEMVTGRPPFLGDDTVAIISQHINTAPVAPTWHNPDVPRSLEALIMRLLAKDPEERPDSASAIPEALEAVMETVTSTSEQPVREEVNPLDRLAGGVFVGREKEMDELRAGLEDSLSGRGRLLMLVGEPGIGKTRTSEELATYAGLRSVQVLWGRCYEGEGAPAYWPWVQVVRSYVHECDPQQLMSDMGPGAADIADVVSEVREKLPGLPAPPTLEPEQARFRLFDSITTFLKNASNRQPIVLILDDLHWSDKPSLLLLQFLARELRGGRLLVLGTYRDVELRRQHPLSQTLAELAREGLTQRILLRGLTQRDVARFIEITAGVEAPDALTEAVYRETEGNPFFVNEVVRLLVADGRLERPETVTSWSVTIPQGVREVVGRRLDHLSEECNRVLTVGSVIGRDFGLRTLEKVSDLSGDRLLEALEEATGARVISEKPQSVDHFTFTHALIRETLYEELSTARRVRLHRQIGEVLEDLEKESIEAHLPQLAYHFSEAAQGGDIEKAIDYATRAAERALALTAYEEAVGHYDRALQVLELKEGADQVQRCELLIALGKAQMMMGDPAKGRETFERAADVARELKSPELLGEAAMGYAQFFTIGVTEEPTVRLLQEALDGLSEEDSALRAKLLVRLGQELYFSDSHEHGRSLAQEAIEMARRVGDPGALVTALWSRLFYVERGENLKRQYEERYAVGEEMIRAAESVGDKAMELYGRYACVATKLMLGDRDGVEREIEAYTRLAKELRQPAFLWQAALFPAMIALLDGRIDDADGLTQKALAIGQRSEGQNALQMYGAQTFAIRREQGRIGEVEAAARGFVEQFPAIPAWRTGLAFLLCEMGNEEEARAEFQILAKDEFAAIPRDGNWPIALALLTEICTMLGDRDRAETLYKIAGPFADVCVTVGTMIDCYGSGSRLLGQLAATIERWDEAVQHFENALKMNAKLRSPRWVARTQLEYARMLYARDEPGDREKAQELVTESLSASQKLGMKAMVDRGLALKLQIQGVDPADIHGSIDAVASAVYVDKPDLRSHAAPDGTVTILFSDIEGSTEMTDRLGDQRWMDLLRQHNSLVREQTAQHEGFEVKSEGDGFMLAFQSARRALQCAVDIQRAFATYNESAEEPVKVRIGLHTGEAIKEADDFYGKNVVLAARIAAQARGGEIVVSGLLKELTESAGDIQFGDGHEVELKGLSGTHRVFQVGWNSS